MSSVSQRLRGYLLAHTMAEIENDPELAFVFEQRELADSELKNILHYQPDAIFTSDIIAVRMMNLATENKLAVPEDLAIVGFDNSPLGSLVNPPLTTVEQPSELMGIYAVEILVDKLLGSKEYQQLTLPTRLVVRRSCGG